MSRVRKIVCLILTSFVFAFMTPTNSRYLMIEFGDAWLVNFSKFSIFAEEFIVEEHLWDPINNRLESDALWGTNASPDANVEDFGLERLKDVSFSVRNNTDRLILCEFQISLFIKNSTNSELTITITNTASPTSANNIYSIVGVVNVKKVPNVKSSNFEVIDDNTTDGNKSSYTFYTHTLDYYNTVEASENEKNEWWTSANQSSEASVSFEKSNIRNYFVLDPGEVFEFNLNVTNNDHNQSGDQSYYPSIKMTAVEYIEE